MNKKFWEQPFGQSNPAFFIRAVRGDSGDQSSSLNSATYPGCLCSVHNSGCPQLSKCHYSYNSILCLRYVSVAVRDLVATGASTRRNRLCYRGMGSVGGNRGASGMAKHKSNYLTYFSFLFTLSLSLPTRAGPKSDGALIHEFLASQRWKPRAIPQRLQVRRLRWGIGYLTDLWFRPGIVATFIALIKSCSSFG